jgi:small subunit ribosomal protein S6
MDNTAIYDLNVILDPSLSEAQVQTEKDAVAAQVERAGGEIADLDEWGHRRLAYEIRKLREGYYLVYTLKLPLTAPKTIEVALRQRDNVMRVLVVRQRPDWHTRKQREKPEAPANAA